MTRREKILATAKLIIETHGGKANYNLRETAEIIGCRTNDVAARLAESGTLCVTSGKNKMVTALDIAEHLYFGHVSTLDNRLRRANGSLTVAGGAG
jgi:hypothetical protein